MGNKWIHSLVCLVPLALNLHTATASPVELTALSDHELSEMSGQSLLSLAYIAPNDSSNKMPGQSVGFYKLGMEADIELNANIKKLQLGCGGVNGAGSCDIDIDNVSLSGISDTREGRAGSSAKLTNPFIEFAIRNPNSASTREVLGLRLSAEKLVGLMTMGEENKSTPNGINSLSGYMKIKDATGTVSTAKREKVSYENLALNITGKARDSLGIITADFTSNSYALNMAEASGALKINGKTINGNRMSTVSLTGAAIIDNIALTGSISSSARLWGFLPIPLSGNITGNINNLNVDVSVVENLGYIHKIPLNNPFSLSLQKENIFWTGADVVAQPGWWMAIEDSVDIGSVTPTQKVVVTDAVIKQVVPLISSYLATNPINCGAFALSCLTGSFKLGDVSLKDSKVNMSLENLQLKNQDFAPNCYGSLKFC